MNTHYRIGLEIGCEQWRFTIIHLKKKGWQLLEVGELEILNEAPEITLANLRKQIPRKIRSVIIGLPFQDIMMKEISMDFDLSSHEIYKFLQLQVPHFFWKQSSECSIDFEVIQGENSQKITVRAVAASLKIINHWRQLFKQQRFKLIAIDIDVLAISRFSTQLQEFDQHSPQALIWAKKTEIFLIIIYQRNFVHIKQMPITQNDSCEDILISSLQYFYHLFPQYDLKQGFLFGDPTLISPNKINSTKFNLKTAALRNLKINPQYYVSLSLGIHSHEH